MRGRVEHGVRIGLEWDESDQGRPVGHYRSCFNSLIIVSAFPDFMTLFSKTEFCNDSIKSHHVDQP